MNKKVSYRKQITLQHLCHKNGYGCGHGPHCKSIPFIKFNNHAEYV